MNNIIQTFTKNRFLQAKKAVTLIRNESGKLEPQSHKVTDLEKKFLVWTKKYKNVEEVPNMVPQSVMERARNRMRIKISNYMIVATLLGCLVMVFYGKQDAKRGESLSKRTTDWHKQLRQEELEKQKAKSD